MSSQQRFLCGTPDSNCTGGITHTDQHFNSKKCHTSRREALRCYRNYLINVAKFQPISPRELVNPESGRIRILPKRSKFGGKLRAGKGEKGARFQPESGSGCVH